MKYDIVALGELLIDFTPCGLSENGMKMAELNPGGAVANVLCAASRMGKRTAFIGKVGDDAHGRYLRSKLIEYGVEPAGLVVSGEAPTTLAFVDIDEKGDRSFTFLRNPGADTLLRADELPEELLCSTGIFHVGSLSLTAEPSRSATLAAVRTAKKSGTLITYDPNYRALLWNSPDEAAAQMRSLLLYVNMIKISDNETMLLTDREAPEDALEYLMDIGIRCAVVTAGDKGAYVGVGGQICHVEGFRRDAVDTTGAGDSFWGGFLTAFLESGISLDDLSAEEACRFARFGCAVAACCVMKRGAMPAMPAREEVEAILAQ